MPILERGRRRKRRRAITLVAAALAGSALMAPSTASAGYDWFCTGVYLHSTWQCRATPVHTLQSVQGYVDGGHYYRICAASAVNYSGPLNSDYACDYSSVTRVLYGWVQGVGVVRNGAPFGYQVSLGAQTW